MITRLPRWVWTGAWLLSLIAGIVNAVGILGLEHQAVTHLTGTTSQLGIAISQMNYEAMSHFLLLLLSFLAGTALSGLIIEDTALKLGRRYPVALLLESSLLCGAAVFLTNQNSGGHYLASWEGLPKPPAFRERAHPPTLNPLIRGLCNRRAIAHRPGKSLFGFGSAAGPSR